MNDIWIRCNWYDVGNSAVRKLFNLKWPKGCSGPRLIIACWKDMNVEIVVIHITVCDLPSYLVASRAGVIHKHEIWDSHNCGLV